MTKKIPKNRQNEQYWLNREKQQQAYIDKNLSSDEQYNKVIQAQYDSLLADINKRIDSELNKLANENGISIADMRAKVSQTDIKQFEAEAKRVVAQADKMRKQGKSPKLADWSQEVNDRLRLYNATMRINRLEYLKAGIGLDMITAGLQVDSELRDKLFKDATEEQKRQAGILGENNAHIDTLAIGNVILAKIKSNNFSQRIWTNMDVLQAKLSQTIMAGITTGQSYDEMARRLKTQVSKDVQNVTYATQRIVRTEAARVQTEITMNSLKRNGYDFCKWYKEPSACHDCALIGNQDNGWGKGIYKVKDVPTIPVHPNCRCAVGAYWVDEKETIARAPYSNKSFNDMLDSVNGISKKDVKEIKKILNQAPEDIQNMFHKYAGFVKWITFDNNNTSGFYYLTKRINFVPDQFMGKNRDYKKYDIFFHEFAHAIDYFYGNHKYFSKNSKIRDALFNDYQNLRDSITLKESIAATQRLLGETKFSELYMDKTNQKSKILLSLNSRKLTLARDELGNFTSDQIEIMKDIKLMEIVRKGKNTNWITQMNVSDIINGVSKGEINPGYGHTTEYWTKYKMQAVEFFAEITSAMINNPESLLQIKKMFPNAYKEYLKVVEDIANG